MKSLYRRYRPMTLGEVVGQPQITEPLSNAIKNKTFSHAYLFIGPRGTGKTSVARIFAHEVNGFKYELEDDYVDIIEIDGASNRGIDNIRELREKAAIAPTLGKYKIYIIDEVHMLTKEAFNALLKTLEEPPKHVIFIMATTDAYKVPVTITSRAQTYTFKLADAKVMFGYLKNVCEKEKIKISDDALNLIVKKGGGSFRDSMSLLDQISTLSDVEITKDLVVSAMGLPEDEKIAALLSYYQTQDLSNISMSLKSLLSAGVKADTLVEELIASIIANPRPGLIQLLSKLAEIKAPFVEAKLLVALTLNIPSSVTPPSQISASLKELPTKPIQKTPEYSNQITPLTNINFVWNDFVETVKHMNDAISSQLKLVDYSVSGNILDIYPAKRVVKMILSKDNNKKILISAAGGMKVVIHDLGENPNTNKDELISKISDIMGGEVQNDSGGNPF